LDGMFTLLPSMGAPHQPTMAPACRSGRKADITHAG
jgi:hypothetical protein